MEDFDVLRAARAHLNDLEREAVARRERGEDLGDGLAGELIAARLQLRALERG